jgi:hypothetical protein
MARELKKIDSFLSGAASELGRGLLVHRIPFQPVCLLITYQCMTKNVKL